MTFTLSAPLPPFPSLVLASQVFSFWHLYPFHHPFVIELPIFSFKPFLLYIFLFLSMLISSSQAWSLVLESTNFFFKGSDRKDSRVLGSCGLCCSCSTWGTWIWIPSLPGLAAWPLDESCVVVHHGSGNNYVNWSESRPGFQSWPEMDTGSQNTKLLPPSSRSNGESVLIVRKLLFSFAF